MPYGRRRRSAEPANSDGIALGSLAPRRLAGMRKTQTVFRNLLLAMTLAIVVAAAEVAGAHRDEMLWSDQQWQQIRTEMALLDRIAYFPSLLPVIMLHRESIGLTSEQLGAFRRWRSQNYREMVGLMNEIIRHRSTFSRDALKVGVTNAELVESQNRMFALQTRLLRIRLSCREIVFDTFTPDQWSNLAFVLEDYPAFAGILGSVSGDTQE